MEGDRVNATSKKCGLVAEESILATSAVAANLKAKMTPFVQAG
jgi:hypothetical protein